MEKGKECYNCRFYRPLYTKGFCQFDKLDYGFCRAQNDMRVEKHGTCELYQRNFRSVGRRKAVALKKLVEAEEDLHVIRQILSEEWEDNRL